MTNEHEVLRIKNKLDKLTEEFGGQGNVSYTREAFHACNPYHPNQWKCNAIRIEGNLIEVGYMFWDFEEELEDASDYDWDDTDSFKTEEQYYLDDDDDLKELIDFLF